MRGATTRVVGRDICDDARIDDDRYLDDRGLQKPKCAVSNLVRHQKQTEFTLPILIKTSTTLSCRKSSGDVVTNPERIGDNREGGIHGADRRKETRVCHVQIIDSMRLAVIENRLLWIGSEPQRASLAYLRSARPFPDKANAQTDAGEHPAC
jgi:hypothetical protein